MSEGWGPARPGPPAGGVWRAATPSARLDAATAGKQQENKEKSEKRKLGYTPLVRRTMTLPVLRLRVCCCSLSNNTEQTPQQRSLHVQARTVAGLVAGWHEDAKAMDEEGYAKRLPLPKGWEEKVSRTSGDTYWVHVRSLSIPRRSCTRTLACDSVLWLLRRD